MFGPLRSIPAKLATLSARLSTTWAAKLDTLAGLVTSTWAAKLDTLAANFTATIAGRIDVATSTRAAATTPLLAPPIVNGVYGANTITLTGIPQLSGASGVTISATAYEVVGSHTGAGVLNFAALVKSTTAASDANTGTLRITIDGEIVSTLTTTTTQYNSVVGAGLLSTDRTASMDQIPFHSSLLVEAKRNGGSGSFGNAYIRWRATA